VFREPRAARPLAGTSSRPQQLGWWVGQAASAGQARFPKAAVRHGARGVSGVYERACVRGWVSCMDLSKWTGFRHQRPPGTAGDYQSPKLVEVTWLSRCAKHCRTHACSTGYLRKQCICWPLSFTCSTKYRDTVDCDKLAFTAPMSEPNFGFGMWTHRAFVRMSSRTPGRYVVVTARAQAHTRGGCGGWRLADTGHNTLGG
jgi:hypothetical protein